MSKKRVSLEDRENMAKPIVDTISSFISQNETDIDKIISTNDDNKKEPKNDTNKNSKNVTKIEADNEPVITYTKRIQVGNDVFKSTYSSNDILKRPAYHLREDTIKKIEICSKLSGLKKAEFVDLILNNVLTDILNKVNKNE